MRSSTKQRIPFISTVNHLTKNKQLCANILIDVAAILSNALFRSNEALLCTEDPDEMAST